MGNSYLPIIGGVETSMVLFRRGLVEQGHRVSVIAPARKGYVDLEPGVIRVPAVELPAPLRGSLGVPLKALVYETLCRTGPALIHSQHPFWMGQTAAALARDLRIPLVFTYHTRYDAYASRYVAFAPHLAEQSMRCIVQNYMQHCAHIIAPTPSIRDAILRDYSVTAPVTVVPTPVDLSVYEHLEGPRIRRELGMQDAELLLYLGRLDREKCLDLLLRALPGIVRRRPRAHLVLVGQGQARAGLEMLSRELGVGQRVTFVGAVDHALVPHYFAAADLFVFPSTTETQGLALIEALAAGTPAVVADAPGLRDILAEGGGVTVPNDEGAFARAVVELLENTGRRALLSLEARRVAQSYSIGSATQRLVAVYGQTAGTGAVLRRRLGRGTLRWAVGLPRQASVGGYGRRGLAHSEDGRRCKATGD